MLFLQPITGRLLLATRILFAVTLVAAFIVAISPVAASGTAGYNDKFLHFLTFYGLGLFAAVAFPGASLLLIAALLSGFGALIELAQGLEIVGRDREFWDWVADTAGLAFALAPIFISGLRARR